MLDIPYLADKVKDSGKSKTFLAKKLGITRSALYSKLSGRTEFNAEEFVILVTELGCFNSIPQVQKFFVPQFVKNTDNDEEEVNAESKD